MTRRPYLFAASAWLAGILILASGCMDQSPTATLLDPATVSAPQAQFPSSIRPIFSAAPFAAGQSSTRITPAGGTIDFGIGTITFPQGAVDQATWITAGVDGSTISVEFGPHLVFDDVQPTLCFDVAGVALSDGIAVIHVTDDGKRSSIEYQTVAQTICVNPASFSKFILAAE